jgi:ADP-ribose pyrophosphatase YjhB (NUDIX family)
METPQLAVGAVVVHDGKLLMVQRGRAPAEGAWTLPGGRVEKGEYIEDALRREVAEETGIAIELDRLLGIFEVVGDPHFVILDYLATTEGGEPEAATDVAAARWVPLDEVESLELTPRLMETLRAWGVSL